MNVMKETKYERKVFFFFLLRNIFFSLIFITNRTETVFSIKDKWANKNNLRKRNRETIGQINK